MSDAFDFSALSVVDTELPKSTVGRKPKVAGPNPFIEPLAQSFEAFQADKPNGKKIVVPAANAVEACNLIRQAAENLKIGARVIVRDSKGQTVPTKEIKNKRGNLTILFGGQTRKVRKPKAVADASESPTDNEATVIPENSTESATV